VVIKDIIVKIKRKLFTLQQKNWAISNADRIRLKKSERYEGIKIHFLNRSFTVVDALTFWGSYQEIFVDEIYNYISNTKSPLIIDCGANIGLATIYFKLKYPDSRIIAFEPDPKIFAALQENIRSFGFENVTCKNEAVSDQDDYLNFWMEGGHSGMIVGNSHSDTTQVKALRLKSLLQSHEHIDFLKIDIEGHEAQVIPDISEELKKVEFMFLEYHSFIGKEQSLDIILYHIKNAGLRYYVQEAFPKKFPFINKEIFHEMDFLCNIFCYRD